MSGAFFLLGKADLLPLPGRNQAAAGQPAAARAHEPGQGAGQNAVHGPIQVVSSTRPHPGRYLFQHSPTHFELDVLGGQKLPDPLDLHFRQVYQFPCPECFKEDYFVDTVNEFDSESFFRVPFSNPPEGPRPRDCP